MSSVAIAIDASLLLAWLVSVVGVILWPMPPSIWILGSGGGPVEAARSSDVVFITSLWFCSNLGVILRHIWKLRNVSTAVSLGSALIASLVPLVVVVGLLSIRYWQITVLPGAAVVFTIAIFVTLFTGLATRHPAVFFVIGTLMSALLTVLLSIGLEFLFFCC